jgi:Flp pilus assembly protein TadG
MGRFTRGLGESRYTRSTAGSADPRDRRGVAAIEFALIAPVLIILTIGVFDISRALTIQQEVYNAAHTIPTSASSLAVQPDKTTTLTVTQVQQALSGIYAEIPALRSGTASGLRSVTLTSVTFQQSDPACVASPTTTCSYVPYAKWSVSYVVPPGRAAGGASAFTSVTRCPAQAGTPLRQVTPNLYTPGDLTSLPTADVTNPDPILVADVHYQYTPLFIGYFMTGPVDFWAAGLWPVRSVSPAAAPQNQYTTYDLANAAGGAGLCP